MESLTELYRIGQGPSSSHTMGPRFAAERFCSRVSPDARIRVTLYGSLAATGIGHGTPAAVSAPFASRQVEVKLNTEEALSYHPNGMLFEALDACGEVVDSWTVYSVGGGRLDDGSGIKKESVYDVASMAKLLRWTEDTGSPAWMLVDRNESSVWDHLADVWRCMREAIERGLASETPLPGGLHLPRRAARLMRQTRVLGAEFHRTARLSAYALAVAEENAGGGIVVTAPTCGSSGVVPAVLHYLMETLVCSDRALLHGLATAGLVGNLIKTNASISGAEVGCQGEVGAACSMAAAAAVQLLGGSPHQIEYAAEMALEHHLGLTCDPVMGLVQIPCIERNAMATLRALDCAEYALLSDGRHRITFDQVVRTMRDTGHDLPSLYRETAAGGLAVNYTP